MFGFGREPDTTALRIIVDTADHFSDLSIKLLAGVTRKGEI